ncbi:hypothetical protein EU537_12755 [Candidatus Thorarchaeota archaeon]|nr:MAG: hypothetical protein EU537_12755 [Candidatus Thorarchaeota archaeon]
MKKERRYGPLLPTLADFARNSRRIGLASKYSILVVLLLDTILIGYVLVSIVFRLQVAGLTLVDSLPIAMYVMPLFVFLSLIIRAHYKGLSKVPSIAVMAIAGAVFAVISPLAVAFIIISFVNFTSSFWLIMTTEITLEIDRSSISKRAIAYLLLLNLIGFLFPVSVYLMGSTPINSMNYEGEGGVYFTLDMNQVLYEDNILNDDSKLIQDLKDTGFGLELVVNYGNNDAWNTLGSVLGNVTGNDIEYSITLDANRTDLVPRNPTVLGTNEIILGLYQRYSSMVIALLEVLNSTLTESYPASVLFDMTLSPEEEALFMSEIREIDLYGFSSLVSASITSINQSSLELYGHQLEMTCEGNNLSPGLIVNSFVLDDTIDGDSTIMLACGVTPEILERFPNSQVECIRTSFSNYMAGDVGEYLCYAFSNLQGSGIISLRLGEIIPFFPPNREPIDPYHEVDALADDIAISLGNGAQSVTVIDLVSGLGLFGSDFLTDLEAILESTDAVPITYTFRIYALRAVVQAVDAFR